MFKKIVIINYILLVLFCVLLNSVYAVQYSPNNNPEIPNTDITTGISSQVLDNLEEKTLEEFVPKKTQDQIDKLKNWGILWSKFINYIILIGVLLLILVIYLERHNIKKVLKRKT